MGRTRGSTKAGGLLLALLLALAVVSALSLRLDPDSRREKQLEEHGRRDRESEVGRRRDADDEESRREVERRRREDDEERRREIEHRREDEDEERRRELERRRSDEDEDRRGRRCEVERRRRDEDEDDSTRHRRREDDEHHREVNDDEERWRDVERRRRDDDEERRREVEHRRREDDVESRRKIERRREDDDEERRREFEHRRRDAEDDERRREVEERRREGDSDEERRREGGRRRRDVDDERRRDVERRREDDEEEHRRREVEDRRRDDDEDRRRDRSRRFQGGGGLLLQEPEEQFSSEGGHIRVWPTIRPLEDSEVYCEAARITLRERGLLLPHYADSASICFVEEGEGLVGLLSGYTLGENARRVRRGDVVAVPKGIAHWWYNSGNQDLRIVALSDTSFSVRGDRDYTPFALIGGRGEGGHGKREEQLRSILHGFRKEFLAEAWDADLSEVDEVLNSQKGVGIIRVERDVDIERAVNVIEEGDISETNSDAQGEVQGNGGLTSEFVYNVRHGTPEVMVEDAGFFNVVNRFKLPLLNTVRLGLTYGRLERNAIFAPHWSPNGHQILHILRGTANLEIAGPGGIKLLNQKVKEGDVIVIPRFHAAGVRAEDEFEWVTFYSTDMPYVEALAGKTSVFKNLPTQVAAAAFNIDEDRVREFRKRRLRHALLLPSHGRQEFRHRRDDPQFTFLV